ncbi:hypothetical protein R9C00_23155 [Flammeovirgaceae bacterium SG7u.111]|nr:hypothetical protein [Flammeovirgaceae bacterium SG7u.132]WPO34604.1 hypothetical protein R9C00_23155 [Flammeovirgaceae bacterium SG7u.111]
MRAYGKPFAQLSLADLRPYLSGRKSPSATDAVHPDLNYYQGPGWYRKQLILNNPCPNERILLHFESAVQKSQVCTPKRLEST